MTVILILDYVSRKSSERLQRYKDTLISSHTHTGALSLSLSLSLSLASLAWNNMHPMPFFHSAWPFAPYRPGAGPWPNPFPHWYPRPQQGSFEGMY